MFQRRGSDEKTKVKQVDDDEDEDEDEDEGSQFSWLEIVK